jgi:gliding motility-associated-like protein
MQFITLRSAGQMTMPDYVCSGETRQYFVIPGYASGSTFIWWIDGVLMSGFGSPEFIRTWNIPNTYMLEVQEISADGCPGPKKSGQVFVNPHPDILIRAPDSMLCSGESVIVLVQNPANLVWGKWMYDLIVEPDEGITGNSRSGTYNRPADLIEKLLNSDTEIRKVNYRFAPRIIADDGNTVCEGEEVKITLWVQPEIRCMAAFPEIPDAFSPNGDGINDAWNITEKESFPDIEVTIYNRWGQMVWKSERGYPVPWDGKSEGKMMPVDSYHYIIELHNGLKPFIGSVTLVR